MRYVFDSMRHLICILFSIEGLHAMAKELGIKRCWFHNGRFPHYDIPLRMHKQIGARCERVTPREIMFTIKAWREKHGGSKVV